MYGQRYDHNRGGSGGNRPPHNEEQARRKNADDVRYFQLCIDQRSKGTFNQRRLSPAQEEKLLFGGIRESTTEDGVISDNIPVERSGARATEVPVLLSFNELEGTIPPFMTQCIKLMKYTNPTPIQKHAIPLGMAEVDLMCCAQTVSSIRMQHASIAVIMYVSFVYLFTGVGKDVFFPHACCVRHPPRHDGQQ
jgi:hypothetical protein